MTSAIAADGQPVENVTFRPFISSASGEAGIFGVVVHDDEGTLVIASLDRPRVRAIVPVMNGVFSAPSLERVRGRFVGLFYAQGRLRRVRLFTKDASRYFVKF